MNTIDGYRGIWYFNQPQEDQYRYKYSGGFATYPQQHVPIAVHCPEVAKTFFCYGGRGDSDRQILNMVSYYDHARHVVARPRVVLARETSDAHFNPTLTVDAQGFLYVFCNTHGPGTGLPESDLTRGKAMIFRSARPWSIEAFEPVRTDNFSYSQPWHIPGQGLLWLHTRYQGGHRRLFCSARAEGERDFSEPRMLAHIHRGSYQISWSNGSRLATVFDYHPDPIGLNARTNLYYLESDDLGAHWRTINGQEATLPLTEPNNAALALDYAKEGQLVYLKDLAFDAAGHPVVLFITSRSYVSGPEGGPRLWRTARWADSQWVVRDFGPADHNYDHGSLYIEPDGAWRMIAPTEPGPQPFGTGGQVAVHISSDQGQTWRCLRHYPIFGGRNQTYVRKPWRADPSFYALWADGNAFELSESHLYFATRDGAMFRLPPRMDGDHAEPERVAD